MILNILYRTSLHHTRGNNALDQVWEYTFKWFPWRIKHCLKDKFKFNFLCLWRSCNNSDNKKSDIFRSFTFSDVLGFPEEIFHDRPCFYEKLSDPQIPINLWQCWVLWTRFSLFQLFPDLILNRASSFILNPLYDNTNTTIFITPKTLNSLYIHI